MAHSRKDVCLELLCIFLVLSNFRHCEASCFGKDAHFKTTDQPTVSQVSKTDPTQVLVKWDGVIKRPECVDKYHVYVWPETSDFKLAKKTTVTEKSGKSVVTSTKVTVEPCINYKFLVELEESDSVTGLNQERTGPAVFRTAAKAKVPSLDSAQLRAGYHWDAGRGVVDLGRADIVIPAHLLTFPSCLDHIQVSGSGVTVTTGPRLTRQRSQVSPARGKALRHLHHQDSRDGHNPSPGVKQPAKPAYSDVTRGSTTPSTPSPSSSPWPVPQFAYSMARQAGSSKKTLRPAKFPPPFLHTNITLTVPVEDCSQYNFDIKFVSGSAVSAVSVVLPALADQPSYAPPPVTSVLTISYNTQARPVYAVKADSGVTAACLPAYFEAYDAYTQRLENEVGWQEARSSQISGLITASRNELTKSQEELLKSLGCQCTSPRLNLTTTDQNILKKAEAKQLGQYHLQGMYNEKPYFMKTGTTEKDNVYLYLDTSKKQWRFASDLGGKKNMFFATEEKSSALCPADPAAEGHWQTATGTFGRMKKNANVKVVCSRI